MDSNSEPQQPTQPEETNDALYDKRPVSTLYFMGEHQPSDWQGVVASAARALWVASPVYRAASEEATAIAERVAKTDRETAGQIDYRLAGIHLGAALELGALIGFALARTWPAQPEDLDGWAERAADYCHFDDIRTEWLARDLRGEQEPEPDFETAESRLGTLTGFTWEKYLSDGVGVQLNREGDFWGLSYCRSPEEPWIQVYSFTDEALEAFGVDPDALAARLIRGHTHRQTRRDREWTD